MDKNVDSITFENTYSSNAATTFKGHKILEGRDLNANEFNFVLQETKSDYQTAIGESKTVSMIVKVILTLERFLIEI